MSLLGELNALATDASEMVHTPENPAYDYVDTSRDEDVEQV
jgi:hypothetical protein